MSTTTEERSAGEPTERVPLDQVMLAMDVVDTLRHQQRLVDRELDDERQEAELIARIQSIYDAQGIEVDEATVAEGVQALRENRFVYTPPKRTFQVRLAEVYVERGKWAFRLLVVAALAVAGWLAWALPARAERRRAVEVIQQRIEAALQRGDELEARLERLDDELRTASERGESPAAREQVAQAESSVTRGRDAATQAVAALQPRPDAAALVDGDSGERARLQGAERDLDQGRAELDRARVLLDGLDALHRTGLELAALLERIDGLTLTPAERAPLDALRGQVQAALDAGKGQRAAGRLDELRGAVESVLAAREMRAALRTRFEQAKATLDALDKTPDAASEARARIDAVQAALTSQDGPRAARSLSRLENLLATLERAYQIRIVSRPGVQSGVWRFPNGNRDGRNYYLIVEAVDEAGRVLRLPVTSEEDGSTRTVKRFGIRVPVQVYERVKADKLDNGLIDRPLVGEKTRGALEPTWEFEVLPGKIHRW